MRKILIAIAIIIVVIIGGCAIFVATFNVNRYHDAIQAQLQINLARKVTLGGMSLHLFPPRFSTQNLVISDDPAFASSNPFLSTRQLDVSVKFFPLLQGNLEIDSVDLQRPTVELIRNRLGVWNFASIGSSAPARPHTASDRPSADLPVEQASLAEPAPASARTFSLAKLSITDGQLAVTDLQGGKPRSVYDHIDATIRNIAPDSPVSFDVAAHLPGAGAEEIRFQGEAGPAAKDPVATPLHGTLDLKEVQISGLRKFLDSPALASADGQLSGQTKISNESGKVAAAGKITVQNPRFDARDLGYPIAADYDLSDDLAADLVTIRNTTLTLGTTPFVISGAVNTKPSPADLDLHLKASGVSIAELAKLAAASGIAFSPGATVAGSVNADIEAKGPAIKPALNGAFSGQDLQISGKEVPQPVSIKSVNLALSPAEIHSDKFNVTSGGTTVAVQFAVQQYLSNSPVVNASLQATGAGLPQLLSMAKAYGVTSLNDVSGSGTLNLDMHASGPVESLSSGAALKTLNGDLSLNLNNVRYQGTDVAYEIATLGGYAKSTEKNQGFTNINKLTGDIPVRNGVAQTSNLLATLDIGAVAVTGAANLATQVLDMRINAVLTREFSQKVGGSGVGGFMTTALSNNQGELVIPAIVTGTFQNPKYAPDLQKMAQMKFKGLVPSSSNPLGALGGILGQKNNRQAQQPGQTQQTQPANAVQQLKGLFGRKKPKPPSSPRP